MDELLMGWAAGLGKLRDGAKGIARVKWEDGKYLFFESGGGDKFPWPPVYQHVRPLLRIHHPDGSVTPHELIPDQLANIDLNAKDWRVIE